MVVVKFFNKGATFNKSVIFIILVQADGIKDFEYHFLVRLFVWVNKIYLTQWLVTQRPQYSIIAKAPHHVAIPTFSKHKEIYIYFFALQIIIIIISHVSAQ